MPALLLPPAVVIVVAIVAGILRYRVHVKVTGQQILGHGPLIAFDGYVPPSDDFDQFEFAATNQSLQGAVYLRAFGAVGEAQDGEEISIQTNYSSEPVRLERKQDNRLESSF